MNQIGPELFPTAGLGFSSLRCVILGPSKSRNQDGIKDPRDLTGKHLRGGDGEEAGGSWES